MFSFIKKLVKVLSNKKYRKNPKGPNLTPARQSALNIGAINAEQTMYFANSLATGAENGEVAENLSDYYGISDRDSALETLEWLKESGHRIYFEFFKQVFAQSAKNFDLLQIEDDEDRSKVASYIANLKECVDTLKEADFIKTEKDLSAISILGWDMGRLVLVTRCCFQCKYISEQEAWNYITYAYDECSKIYKNWKDFAGGYIVGRAMWGGASMSLDGLIGITEDLLSDAESPWIKAPFVSRAKCD